MALTPHELVPSSSPVSACRATHQAPWIVPLTRLLTAGLKEEAQPPRAGLMQDFTAPVGRFNAGDFCSYTRPRPCCAQGLPGGLGRFCGPSAADPSGSSSVRSPPGVSPKPDSPNDMKVLSAFVWWRVIPFVTCTQPPPLLSGGCDAAAGIRSSVKPSSFVSYG